MKVVIQRVKEAKVVIAKEILDQIRQGLVVFLGIEEADAQTDADYLTKKITHLRIFEDANGKMNLSVKDIKGEILIISQFTLLGDCRKGNRPSLNRAAKPQVAQPLCDYFVQKLKEEDLEIKFGIFGAMMQIYLVNDGPVTFILDSNR